MLSDENVEQNATPRWLISAQLVTTVLTFMGTFWLSLSGKAAAPFAIAGVGLLLLFRFGDIASLTLEGLGGRAELRRATRKASRVTEEAENTLDALKELTMNISRSLLLLTASQSNPQLRREAGIRPATIPAITANLRAMGIEESQIRERFQDVYFLIARSFLENASGRFSDYEAIREEISWTINQVFPMDMSAIRQIFVEHERMSPELDAWLYEIDRLQRVGDIDMSKRDAFYNSLNDDLDFDSD